MIARFTASFSRQIISGHLDDLFSVIKPKRIANRCQHLGRYVRPKPRNGEKIAVFGKFKADCRARGCRKTSINTYLRHIRGFLNKAHDWGYINGAPKIDLYRLGKRHPRVLTEKERKAILKAAKNSNYELYRIIQFALWTGARRAEIASLTWQNVQGNKAALTGKGGKERTIPLLPAAKKAMGRKKDIGHVFIHYNDLSKYTKEFKAIAREAGIEDVHFHNLRHTAATKMIESGIELAFVQEMLGHSSVTTTQIYAIVVQKTLQEKMKKLKY